MSAWPGSNDYTIAIQSPRLCFRDADLHGAVVERTRLTGMPKVWTGNFAQVYELKGARGRWAVKCFTRSAPDLRTRYRTIAKAIDESRLPYFVAFTMLDDGILVGGQRYPIVKMQWIDGLPLDTFVERQLFHPATLIDTAAKLLALVHALEGRRLAHGDLQHGNIVMTDAGMKLVDYDGLFVPAFAGTSAPERGLAAYQHPKRSVSDYGVGLDRFAALVICTGLSALAVEPRLWYEFSTGDNILFTGDDFKRPRDSRVFQKLRGLADPRLRTLVDTLAAACDRGPLDIPLPDGPLWSGAESRRGVWWTDSARTAAPIEPAARKPAARRGARARSLRAFARYRGATASAAGGIVVVGISGTFGLTPGLLAAVCLVVAYVIERLVRYRALPAPRKRRRLRAKIRRLERTLAVQQNREAALRRRIESIAGTGETVQRRRRKAAADLERIGVRCLKVASTLSTAESDFKQLNVPSFAHYLKHSF